jgi:hypothetical protein
MSVMNVIFAPMMIDRLGLKPQRELT